MKKLLVLLIVGLFIFVSAGSVSAQGKASAAQAKLWVDKADAYVKEHGPKAAIAEFNNPKGKFVKGDLYIFVWDLDGNILAHPMSPKIVGQNNVNSPDVDGKFWRRDAINTAKTKGSGWIDYKYKHPKTNQIEQKTSYVKKVGDIIVVCGAWK